MTEAIARTNPGTSSVAPAHRALTRVAFWSLVAVTAFNAVSAIAGGIGVIATDGLGMPRSMIASGPFTSFLVPGILLLVVVGGTHAAATGLLLTRRESALLWSAVAGLGMTIWIFIETGIIAGLSALQVIYFATGTAEIVLVLALLGIVAWLPRVALRDAATKRR